MTFFFRRKIAFFALICVLFFIHDKSLFSEDNGTDAENAVVSPSKSSFREFLFHISYYSLTGKTDFDEVKPFAIISRQASEILLVPFWNAELHKIERLYEIFYSEKAHFIQKSDAVEFDFSNEFDFSAEESDFSVGEELSLLDELESNPLMPQSEEKIEVIRRQKNGGLRKFSYDGEYLSVLKNGDETVLTKVFENRVARKHFDKNLRLKKTEQFNNPKKSADFALEKETDFFYDADSAALAKKIEDDVSGKKRTEYEYDENGLLRQVNFFVYSENQTDGGAENKSDEKNQKIEILPAGIKKIEYDSEKRIKRIEEETYSREKNLRGEEKLTVCSQTTEYAFSGNLKEPDIFKYENGILRMEKIWKDDARYVQTVYFDGDYSVKSEYKDGVKMLEIFYIGGKEIRRNRTDGEK